MKLYLQKHAGGWIWPTGPSLPSPVLNDATFCQFSGLPLCLVHTLFFSQVNWVATANIWVYLSTHIWFLQLWYYEKVRNSEHNRLVLLISWLFGKLLSFFEPLSCDCKWRFFFKSCDDWDIYIESWIWCLVHSRLKTNIPSPLPSHVLFLL